jgi:hypothetical protein
MTASFRKIDYSLRPAKYAERRMLSDIFRRLSPFNRVEDYVYVGFGSVWFSDFILFHRALGVKDMISIEEAQAYKARIEENKPFRIAVDYRNSKTALPSLPWQRKQFIWLDYDTPLSTDMLYDMQTVSRRASSGTVLAVSVQCRTATEVDEVNDPDYTGQQTPFERFIARFKRERVPTHAAPDDLYAWRFGALSRQMLSDEIATGLASRNAAQGNSPMTFTPICGIEYEDGAKMTTLVGVFSSVAEQNLLTDCKFDALDFISGVGNPVRITVPKLTVREFKRLESQLPLEVGAELELGTIPPGEAKNFQKLYRYLPSFAVLES